MNRFLLSILCTFGCIHSAVAASTQDPLSGIDELGRYIGAVRASQSIVHRMLDYCANEVPDKKAQIENAKAQWNTNNQPLVSSINEVANGWFSSTGIPQSDIPEILAVIDPSMDAAAGIAKPDEKAVAVLAALEPEERKRRCGFYTGLVIGGGQDVQIFFPKALEFHRKYAPSNP